MDIAAALRRAFRIGCAAAGVLAASVACWGWLLANGDQPGADGARGVICVTALLLGLDLAAMIVLLALAELSRARS